MNLRRSRPVPRTEREDQSEKTSCIVGGGSGSRTCSLEDQACTPSADVDEAAAGAKPAIAYIHSSTSPVLIHLASGCAEKRSRWMMRVVVQVMKSALPPSPPLSLFASSAFASLLIFSVAPSRRSPPSPLAAMRCSGGSEQYDADGSVSACPSLCITAS